jgi:hypothetical protein
MSKLRQFLWLTILAILVGATACESRETELPFETIEQGDWAGYGDLESDSIPQTRLVLVTSRDGTAQLEGMVSPEAMDQLARLDFGRYFAIALFRGRQASSGYDTIIERVARQGDEVVVYAQFWEPSPYYAVTDEATSPYHMIKVRRDDGVIQETELVLQSRTVTPTPPSR